MRTIRHCVHTYIAIASLIPVRTQGIRERYLPEVGDFL